MLYGYRQVHCIHKKDDICKDIEEDVKTRFDISNYELDRPLSTGKNKGNWINERWSKWEKELKSMEKY